MISERDRMLAGELYDPLDPQLVRERDRCRELCLRLNAAGEDRKELRQRLLCELFGGPTDAWVQPPFFCDYGTNIALGRQVFFNFNCVVLDVAQVSIGNHVLFGPAAQIYTATHPLGAAQRRQGREAARPIRIGDDVWVGGGAIICPGVTIGDRAIIGAGAVVTRDVAPGTVVGVNPARVIRTLPGDPSGA